MPGQRDSRTKTVKFKGKRQMRQGPTSMPAQRQGVQQAQPGFNVLQEEPESGSLVDQIEFEQRLKALKVRRAVLRLHVRLLRGWGAMAAGQHMLHRCAARAGCNGFVPVGLVVFSQSCRSKRTPTWPASTHPSPLHCWPPGGD